MLLKIVFSLFRACEAECFALKNILSLYQKASGQVVNFHKSGVFSALMFMRGKNWIYMFPWVCHKLWTQADILVFQLFLEGIRNPCSVMFSLGLGKTTEVAWETSFKSREGGFT